jgi:Phosphoketolase
MTSRVLIEEPAPRSLSAYGKARSTVQGTPLTSEELRKTHAYWQACNYLALGMIYLQANPLLKEPLKPEHIKNRLLGHWGSSPGLAFTYIHLNRLIKKRDLDVIFMAGPGHGAPGGSRAGVSGGYILRNISGKERGRSWSARVR